MKCKYCGKKMKPLPSRNVEHRNHGCLIDMECPRCGFVKPVYCKAGDKYDDERSKTELREYYTYLNKVREV
jgi:hypothetical protein